jgi:sensor c-di-GMP phosphodiesterase-like protein
MNVAAQQRLTLETALRRALDARQFELYYQPLYDLTDRSITGFEALLRWNGPGGDVVSPGSSSRWPRSRGSSCPSASG